MTHGISKALTAFEARAGSLRTQDRAAPGQDFGKALARADEPRAREAAPSLEPRLRSTSAQPRSIEAFAESADRPLLQFVAHPEPAEAPLGVGSAHPAVKTRDHSGPEDQLDAAKERPGEDGAVILHHTAPRFSPKTEYPMHPRSSPGVFAGSPSAKMITVFPETHPPFGAAGKAASLAATGEKTEPSAYNVRDRLSAALDALPAAVLAAPSQLGMDGEAPLGASEMINREASNLRALDAGAAALPVPPKRASAQVALVEAAPLLAKAGSPEPNVEAPTAAGPASEPSGRRKPGSAEHDKLVSRAPISSDLPHGLRLGRLGASLEHGVPAHAAKAAVTLPARIKASELRTDKSSSPAASAPNPLGIAPSGPEQPSPPISRPLSATETLKGLEVPISASAHTIWSTPSEASAEPLIPAEPPAPASERIRPTAVPEGLLAAAFPAPAPLRPAQAATASGPSASRPETGRGPGSLDVLLAAVPQRPAPEALAIDPFVLDEAFAPREIVSDPAEGFGMARAFETDRGPAPTLSGAPHRRSVELQDDPERPAPEAPVINPVALGTNFAPLDRKIERDSGVRYGEAGASWKARDSAPATPGPARTPERRAPEASEEPSAPRRDIRPDTSRIAAAELSMLDSECAAPQAPEAAPRVEILAERSLPAPASPALSQNAAALTGIIAAEPAWRANAALPLAPTHVLAAVQTLQIQLKPVELGTVTANLRIVGEHLRIEIEVENAEAYHRLSAETETIARTLRGLGFEIDQVTIQAPLSVMAPTLRTDAAVPSPNPASRDNQSLASNHPGGGGEQGAGRETARENRHDGRPGSNNGAPARARGGDGVYI